MRKVDGYPLWIGNAGDLRRSMELHAQGIEAVVDLAASEPAATLPREVVYCRFPIVDGGGNSPWDAANGNRSRDIIACGRNNDARGVRRRDEPKSCDRRRGDFSHREM